MFEVSPDSITKSVPTEKWEKGITILARLKEACDSDALARPILNRKQLERETGFLNHLAMTYDTTTPFLKGFYLTLNSWRPWRDDEDWKMPRGAGADINDYSLVDPEEAVLEDPNHEAPDTVKASPRFASDVGAFISILGGNTPPVVQLRARSIVSVVFGFGDASGTGLGSTFTCGQGFSFRIGVWGSLEKDESSNWKEFSNVVESLEEEAELGNLQHSEVFMFTDNATVEACSYKGSSSLPKLLSLIIRLLSMSTRHGIKLHIFHVAGTRMIAQGTDGVSRGCLAHGVMGGEEMVSFIPIHKSATERSDSLLPWIRSWCGQSSIALSEADWFDVGHDIDGWFRSDRSDLMEKPKLEEGRTYIWSPPRSLLMWPSRSFKKPESNDNRPRIYSFALVSVVLSG